jgi:hypothetical protein
VGHHEKDASPSPTLGHKHKEDATLANAVGQCPAKFVVAGHAPFAVTSVDSANSAAGLPLLLVSFWPATQLLWEASHKCADCVLGMAIPYSQASQLSCWTRHESSTLYSKPAALQWSPGMPDTAQKDCSSLSCGTPLEFNGAAKQAK